MGRNYRIAASCKFGTRFGVGSPVTHLYHGIRLRRFLQLPRAPRFCGMNNERRLEQTRLI